MSNRPYTITEGITFKEYAINTAKQFGYLFEMRELPADAPLPVAFPLPSREKHLEKLAELRAEKKQILAMSDEEIETTAKQEHENAVKSYQDYLEKKISDKEKYEAMLAQVEAYEVPSRQHKKLKKVMKDQIIGSIAQECDIEYTKKTIEEIIADGPQPVAEWRQNNLDCIENSIKREHKSYRRGKNSAQQKERWVTQLKSSLEM